MGTAVDHTFNWFYVDGKDIGYQHSCKCPQRAPGVDPYLPVWGTGEWDWQGFIPLSAQPNDLNPPAGFLTSWNNKQAPQFRSNDRQFSYGPVFRSQMLDVRIRAAITAGPIDRADLVDAMGDAGTVDLRGQEDLPLLLQVLGPTAPAGSDPRSQDMRDRLATRRPTSRRSSATRTSPTGSVSRPTRRSSIRPSASPVCRPSTGSTGRRSSRWFRCPPSTTSSATRRSGRAASRDTWSRSSTSSARASRWSSSPTPSATPSTRTAKASATRRHTSSAT